MRSILLAVLASSLCGCAATVPSYSLEAPPPAAEHSYGPIGSTGAQTGGPPPGTAQGGTPVIVVQSPYTAQPPPRPPDRPLWRTGQTYMQGFFGWTDYSDVSVDFGSDAINGEDGDLDSMPILGGGGQYKLGGERLDFGLEGLFSFGGRANAAAFAVGGGGAAIAVDVDLFLFELYGGPFVSMFIGKSLRVYGAVGPLLQWAYYDQAIGGAHDDGNGFGTGVYARAGFEILLPSRTMLGFGARWSDSSIDLGGSLGDLDIEGIEYMITVTRGF